MIMVLIIKSLLYWILLIY